jgi:MoaA/NifB/PqqE/SkfB family radical SAM enzyme
MDVKVTDYCDANCPFCHEKSTVNGKHSDENFALSVFDGLPKGTELAIGGGNPLSWPGIDYVLGQYQEKGLICNMTVNSVHIRRNMDTLRYFVENKLIRGLGISYFPSMIKECAEVAQLTNNTVFHVIMGVHTVDDLRKIMDVVEKPKVLLLGYKQYGRGEKYYNEKIEKSLYQWYTQIHEFFNAKNLTLSFDNLGIKQMNFKRFFTDDNWKKFYMGDDGNFTMYVDLINKQYAVSSTSKVRHDIGTMNIQQMFAEVRKIKYV